MSLRLLKPRLPLSSPLLSYQKTIVPITIRKMSNTTNTTNTIPAGQPADPYKSKNLDTSTSLSTKVSDLAGLLDGIKTCMLTTRRETDGFLVSRCMQLAAREHDLDLVFTTNVETGKIEEIKEEDHVNVSFVRSSSGEWASVSGTASLSTDRASVKEYYSPTLRAWLGDLGDGVHDGGPEDPRIGVIRVKTHSATYAIDRKTMVGKAVEVVKGVVGGEVAGVNALREISVEEVETIRRMNA
ncbi:hypothetical protein YB2330_004438 [Saitoella coloradoensis]